MTVATEDVSANDIIRKGLKKARLIPVRQPIQAHDFNNGLEALNDVIKLWRTQGLHLWTETQAILPLNTAQRQYFLGPNGANAAKANSFVDTTLSADQVTTDTIINVTSTTGIEGADGILLVDPVLSTQDWTAINNATLAVSSGILITNVSSSAGGASYDLDTTIGKRYRIVFDFTLGTSTSVTFTATDTAGTLATTTETATGTYSLSFTATDVVTTFTAQNVSTTTGHTSTVAALQFYDIDSGDYIGILLDDDTRFWSRVVFVTSTVEIADGLTSGATSGNSVYSYETPIERPIRILQAQFGEDIAASEIPVNQWSREEYFDQPDKDSSGTVVQWYYSPQKIDGEIYVWQVAANADQVLRFTYERPIYLSVDSADTVDIPPEWELPLIWAMAAELGPEYGIPAERQGVLEGKASIALSSALGNDVERDSIQIQPDFNN